MYNKLMLKIVLWKNINILNRKDINMSNQILKEKIKIVVVLK